MLNVWGTWCAACRQEHNALLELQRTSSVPLVGMDWHDDAVSALDWLSRLGNPYSVVAIDRDGSTAVNLTIDPSFHLAIGLRLAPGLAPTDRFFIAADATGPKHFNKTLTREQFEGLVADLIQQTVEPCNRALEDAKLQPHNIDIKQNRRRMISPSLA